MKKHKVLIILAVVFLLIIIAGYYWWASMFTMMVPDESKCTTPNTVKCWDTSLDSIYDDFKDPSVPIPCETDSDCTFENMGNFCEKRGESTFTQIMGPSRYVCGNEGYCVACTDLTEEVLNPLDLYRSIE